MSNYLPTHCIVLERSMLYKFTKKKTETPTPIFLTLNWVQRKHTPSKALTAGRNRGMLPN